MASLIEDPANFKNARARPRLRGLTARSYQAAPFEPLFVQDSFIENLVLIYRPKRRIVYPYLA